MQISNTLPQILRLPQVMEAHGLGSTAIYARVKTELLTPPIKLTSRSSGWRVHEIVAITSSIIAGATDDELRTLVRQLVAARKQPRSALGVNLQTGAT